MFLDATLRLQFCFLPKRIEFFFDSYKNLIDGRRDISSFCGCEGGGGKGKNSNTVLMIFLSNSQAF